MPNVMPSFGPWEVHENAVRTVAPGRCVARMDWDIRDEVDDANMQLISATPDLLDAVRNLMGLFDNAVYRRRLANDGLYADTISHARSALAKAGFGS